MFVDDVYAPRNIILLFLQNELFEMILSRALTNYAMFQIPLALLLTLESIGPLYSLPLALLMHKECPSFRASIGAVFAVTGIALLSLHGKTN